MEHFNKIIDAFTNYTSALIKYGASIEEAEKTWAEEYGRELANFLNRQTGETKEAFMRAFNEAIDD